MRSSAKREDNREQMISPLNKKQGMFNEMIELSYVHSSMILLNKQGAKVQ